MNESIRIEALFEDLYNGSPWIDVNIQDTMQQITAEQASKKFNNRNNSIWEIVNHMISWRFNVLKRLEGFVISTPASNYFSPVEDPTDIAWADTIKLFELSQLKWIAFLKEIQEKDFENVYTNNNMSYYKHIHGIIQHDCYHLGQIVLLWKAQVNAG